MRRRMMGVVVAIVVAVTVALQWLPSDRPPNHEVRASTPTEITLAIRAEGLAIHVERGNLALTFEF